MLSRFVLQGPSSGPKGEMKPGILFKGDWFLELTPG